MDLRDLSSPAPAKVDTQDAERKARNDARRQARWYIHDLLKSLALAMEPLEDEE